MHKPPDTQSSGGDDQELLGCQPTPQPSLRDLLLRNDVDSFSKMLKKLVDMNTLIKQYQEKLKVSPHSLLRALEHGVLDMATQWKNTVGDDVAKVMSCTHASAPFFIVLFLQSMVMCLFQ